MGIAINIRVQYPREGDKEEETMIDLRSDTLTMPSHAMLETVLTARLGDDGRVGENGRGEDAAVNELEDRAAALTGKEAAVFFPTGTLGNTTALMTWCRAGDPVLVEAQQHILVSEIYPFAEDCGRLRPVCYGLDETHQPSIVELEAGLERSGAKLVCIENTHNFSGGYCIGLERMQEIRAVADCHQAKIHMDGARVFHAAAALDCTVEEICRHVDSVMFCISKGLGAPIGSLLCGSREFIAEARQKRKLFGGVMRQAGIAAAPGLYALEHNVERLGEDIRNTQLTHSLLQGKLKHLKLQEEVQSNILILSMEDAPISADGFAQRAKEQGLLVLPLADMGTVRLVFHLGNQEADAKGAAEIIAAVDNAL